jgi:hypothetical protein
MQQERSNTTEGFMVRWYNIVQRYIQIGNRFSCVPNIRKLLLKLDAYFKYRHDVYFPKKKRTPNSK